MPSGKSKKVDKSGKTPLESEGKMGKLTSAFGCISTKVRCTTEKIPLNVRRVLWVITLLVGLYLVLMPLAPQFSYYIKQIKGELEYSRSDDFLGEPTSGENGDDGEPDDEIPEENMLYIPVIGINVPIVEGQTDAALNYGAWHRPGTGDPEIGSNMVITGHRFRYLPPNNLTFYHLPKIEEGDDIIIYWNGEKYEYVVDSTFVVNSDQIEVEAATADVRVTLYTCTPLWTAKQRFVVVAKPIGDDTEECDSCDEKVELEELDTDRE